MTSLSASTFNAIHPTAIIHPSAKIADQVNIGPFCIIGENVIIGAGTTLESHIVVRQNTTIGQGNHIFQFCSIGERPQDLKYRDEVTWLEIGDFNIIREHCTLHRGTVQDQGVTRVGHHNLFMANTHLAHDCLLGNHNILANNVGIAGHVHIGDHVVIGGQSGIHQFCRIGSYSMVGGCSLIVKDVAAFVMVAGNPARARGMNIEGMRRKSWSSETIAALRQAYKTVFQQGSTMQQAIDQLCSDLLPQHPEIQLLVDSLEGSTRGITR